MIKEKYKEINSEYCAVLFSPYLDEENYSNCPNKHKDAEEYFKELGFNIMCLKDDDKTFFIYHKKEDRDYVWEKTIEMSEKYKVAVFFMDVNGLESYSEQDSLNNILSVDYEEIK